MAGAEGLTARERIILSLEGMGYEEASALLRKVGGYVGMVKIGSIGLRTGLDQAVAWADRRRLGLMVDLKSHNMPRAMEDEAREVTLAGPRFFTAHADDTPSGKALRATVAGRDRARTELAAKGREDTATLGKILGITVLTSWTNHDALAEWGMPVADKVMERAVEAAEAGFDGVVCSAHELDMLNSDQATAGLLKVIPGIVLPGMAKPSGQERTATPDEAIRNGADYLVVGSAITKAEDPGAAAQQIWRLTDAALHES